METVKLGRKDVDTEGDPETFGLEGDATLLIEIAEGDRCDPQRFIDRNL
jgi:hypothetical protein